MGSKEVINELYKLSLDRMLSQFLYEFLEVTLDRESFEPGDCALFIKNWIENHIKACQEISDIMQAD